ncbi:MAG: sulfatase-like hydrolase/transferase [Proteobacteria bacterium]|nr:sulfatase-like hydrolase/transferase [Pseudomonadota bacterium]MCP4918031.1 sulfatase-like hydrolase/transferase [Pseudomonadota bacterium]
MRDSDGERPRLLTPGERATVLAGWAAIAASELAVGRLFSRQATLAGAAVEVGALVGIGALHAWLANIRALRGPFAPVGWALALGMLIAAEGPLRIPAALGMGFVAVVFGVFGHLLEERFPVAGAPVAILFAPVAVIGRLVMEVWYARHGDLSTTLAALQPTLPWLAVLVPAAALAVWDGRAGFALLLPAPLLALDPVDPPPPDRGDSIILITVDTLRRDAGESMDSYERLAEQGIAYTDAVSASTWTLPALASVHTGRLPASHGAGRVGTSWLQLESVDPSVTTLAEYLGPEGYTTSAVVTNPFVGHGLDKGFDDWLNLSLRAPLRPIGLGLGGRTLDLASFVQPDEAEVVVDEALRWLDHAPGGDVFLWVHFLDPHLPYHHSDDHQGTSVRDLRQGTLRPAERDAVRAAYDAEVAVVDEQIGRLLDELDARAMSDTTVVLTSDHGEEFWEHGGVEHGHAFHDEVVGVPLVIRWGTTRKGQRTAFMASGIDILPSLLADRGWPAPEGLDGVVFEESRGVPRRVEGTLYGAARDAEVRGVSATVRPAEDGAGGDTPTDALKALGYLE